MPKSKSNKDLQNYITKKKQLLRQEEAAVKKIRDGLKDVVVMFIDIADSTKMKTGQLKSKPEIWINKIYAFGQIVSGALKIDNGQAVKFIGDEVMAVFKGKNKVLDAVSFIDKLKDIEQDISNATGQKTKIKISLDYGKIYDLKYAVHRELDPQGTPVDRCARISKLCQPSTVLTSASFVKQLMSKKEWHSLGKTKLKGLGLVEIFQYKNKNVELERHNRFYYHILNKKSHNVIDVNGSSFEDEAQVILYPNTGYDNQVWEFCKKEDGFYCIINKNSSKCLEVKGGLKENSTTIQQNSYKGTPEQLWKVVFNPDCSVYLLPKHSKDKYLEQDANTINNEIGKLIQHEAFNHSSYGREHQKWFLIPVNLE